ncbi:MAG: hypothetical protein Q4B23_00195 [Helcococcus sp.]|nr:hypothetical protein [Helcococcus sp.]
MDTIKFTIPSNPRYLQMLRLSCASIANSMGFDIEAIEDIKVIVSELFTYLLSDVDEIKVDFVLHDTKLNIVFYRHMVQKEGLNEAQFELKKQILMALSDDIVLEDERVVVSVYL